MRFKIVSQFRFKIVPQLKFKIVPRLIFKIVPQLKFKIVPCLRFKIVQLLHLFKVTFLKLSFSNSTYCNYTWFVVVFQYGIAQIINRIDNLDYKCKWKIKNSTRHTEKSEENPVWIN